MKFHWLLKHGEIESFWTINNQQMVIWFLQKPLLIKSQLQKGRDVLLLVSYSLISFSGINSLYPLQKPFWSFPNMHLAMTFTQDVLALISSSTFESFVTASLKCPQLWCLRTVFRIFISSLACYQGYFVGWF